MRQYKTVVRTLLVLSVVDYTFASLALSRAIRGARSAGTEVLKVAEDVTHMGMGSDKEAMGLKANAPPEPASPDPKPNSEEVVFFNGELREKVQEYYIMATLLAVTTSVSRAAQFQISDKVDPGRYVSVSSFPLLNRLDHKNLVCLSSTVGRKDFITRTFGVSQTLNDHRQGQEDLVSRSLTNWRDGDLRFLGTLSSRLLESLD